MMYRLLLVVGVALFGFALNAAAQAEKAPETYKVKFDDCHTYDYLTQWYDGNPDQASADVVNVADGVETSGIDARPAA